MATIGRPCHSSGTKGAGGAILTTVARVSSRGAAAVISR
jgi:hypothetical protein